MTRKNLILIVVRAFLKIRVFGLRSLTLLSGDMTTENIQKTYSVMILIEMVLLD